MQSVGDLKDVATLEGNLLSTLSIEVEMSPEGKATLTDTN